MRPPVGANEFMQGVAPDKAISMLWKDREESSFIDLRGKRKVAVVQSVDDALGRATSGLIQQLPRSVKEAAGAIATLSRDGKNFALGRRLTGRDTAPTTIAAVHCMGEHMAEEALLEDGYNAQCAVLQGLHAVCDGQAACGAELDIVKAQT